MRRPARRTAVLRLVVGTAVSAVLLAATLVRVDLPSAGAAVATAAPGMLLVAGVVVILDLVLRSLRWQVLLRPLATDDHAPPLRSTSGYLSIGYLANVLLPARLGDVARAYLAADAFRLGRLATFGTIAVERAADGIVMLGLAALSVVVVGAGGTAEELVVFGLLVVALGTAALVAGWLVLMRSPVGDGRVGAMARSVVTRIGTGARALRDPAGLTWCVGLTVVVTITNLVIAWAVLRSVGLELAPMGVALFVSVTALSLAIPAAPGAIGTYEFAGVTLLAGLGHPPELALAAMVLMRLCITLPVVVAGLAALGALQLRPGALAASTAAGGPWPHVASSGGPGSSGTR